MGRLCTYEPEGYVTTTLLQLKTQARQRSDMEGSDFVSDSELTSYINSSIAELHDLLVGTYGPDYFVEKYQFSTVAGTEDYALPSNFYKLKGVDALLSGTQYYSLRPFNFNERNRHQDINWSLLAGPSIRYRLVGNNLKFNPAPDAGYSMRLWFIPTPTPLVLDADIYNDVNSYAEYVIVDAAIKMLQKEESDVSVLASQKMDLRKRIENMAANRDADQPESISDIYADNDPFWLTRS